MVVLLHGYGADGKDLIEIGRQWRTLLPDAAFIAPNAPQPCAMSPLGRQWFALSGRAGSPAGDEDRWKGALEARPGIDAFLDAELARLGLDDSRLALVGFSQGAMMALHVGLRRKRAPASILAYSGILVGTENLHDADARDAKGARPPILLVHGEADDVIPLDALFISCEALAKADIPAQWHLSLGTGHGIDPGGLRHGGQFIARGFGIRPAASGGAR